MAKNANYSGNKAGATAPRNLKATWPKGNGAIKKIGATKHYGSKRRAVAGKDTTNWISPSYVKKQKVSVAKKGKVS